MENKLSDRRRIDMTKVRRMSGLQAVSGMPDRKMLDKVSPDNPVNASLYSHPEE